MSDGMTAEALRAELERVPISKRVTPTKATLSCPFHADRTPSCSVNLEVGKLHKGRQVPLGYFFCFGCPARGPWNVLAEKLGLRQFETGSGDIEVYGRRLSTNVYQEVTEERILQELSCVVHTPITGKEQKKWRGFSYRFLSKFKAYECLCADSGEPCLVFPVISIDGTLVGGFKAYFKKFKDYPPSYVNMPGAWTLDDGLWPLPMVWHWNPKTIWLVEGQRDALRLVRLGIPALCIFGTQNWGPAKRDLVLGMGVERVVLMFDGDKAGVQCTNAVRADLQSHIDVRVVKMRVEAKKIGLDKLDPMDCEKSLISKYFKRFSLDGQYSWRTG